MLYLFVQLLSKLKIVSNYLYDAADFFCKMTSTWNYDNYSTSMNSLLCVEFISDAICYVL